MTRLLNGSSKSTPRREGLLRVLYKGRANLIYVTRFYPDLPGWEPTWEQRFPEMYGYDLKEVVDPKVVDDLAFPGWDGGDIGHPWRITACMQEKPCRQRHREDSA
jgi:hypothetical protein